MKPGRYDDLDEIAYHGDRESLSVAGAKKLLPPSCPAIFRHEQDHGQPHKAVFDFGHAAHAKVLGAGAELVIVEVTSKDGQVTAATDYRSKSAQEHRDEIRAAGATPVLLSEVEQIDGMAEAIKAHPIASALLDPDHGKPEVSGFWQDKTHDVLRRFRLDWLPETDGGRLIVPDYKSAASAEPGAIRKAVANYGYFMQDAWYRDGCHALELAEDIAFVFIFQEKTAPYLVTVVELDAEAVLVGRKRNDQALQVFSECRATDTWPGYTSDVELISLPGWATYGMDTAA